MSGPEAGVGNLAKALRSGPLIIEFCGDGNEIVPFWIIPYEGSGVSWSK